MNKWQKQILQSQLNSEQEVLNEIKKTYEAAIEQIDDKIAALMGRTDLTNLQSIIYQVDYQKALKKQISAILDDMNAGQFQTVSEYLTKCYENSFIGVMYDLQGQGIPLIFPIDQQQVTMAVVNNSKISEGLYTKLGYDVNQLKKTINNEVSRGIATSLSYAEVARNISRVSDVNMNKTYRIARTEGHRISNAAAYDAQKKAKNAGADVVKQWHAGLDKRTRPHHAQLDGQIREIDEPFEIAGHKAMYPGGFGIAAEDINCRCGIFQRAITALDEDDLQRLKDRAAYYGLDKTKDFEDFKKKYLNTLDKNGNDIYNGTVKTGALIFFKEKQFDKKAGKHAIDFGLDPASEQDRNKLLEIINEIVYTSDEVRIGEWRGQDEEVLFYISGQDVVITKQSKEYVTVLKGGITNVRVKNARIK